MDTIKFTVPTSANVTKKKVVLVNMNWYRNAHHFQSNKVKKFYKELIAPQVASVVWLSWKYKVHYDIYIKRRGTDGGNIRSVIEKFALDGLIDCGVLKDDNFEIITGSSDSYFLDRENPRCEITLTKQ